MTADMLPIATLDEILAIDDRPAVDVDVDGWGRVRVRGMTRAAVLAWVECEDAAETEALVLHHGLADPAVTLEQAREILDKAQSRPVVQVVREVLRLTGIAIPAADQGGAA